MILLTITLGSRNYFSRRALMPEDHLLRQKILRISLDIFPETLVLIAFAIHYHRCIPMDIYMHLSFSWSFLVALVVTRCLEISFDCPENPLSLLSCSFISHENPYGFFLTFIEDPFFSIVHVSHQILRNTFRFFKNPLQPVILEILACLHYG